MTPYHPPAQFAYRYHQFGSSDLRGPLSRVAYRGRGVALYPHHLGDTAVAEACMELNEIAHKHLKARYLLSVTLIHDELNLPLFYVQRLTDDLPRGLRIKPTLFETYFHGVGSLIPGSFMRLHVPHKSLSEALQISAHRLSMHARHPFTYDFTELELDGQLYLSVTRRFQTSKILKDKSAELHPVRSIPSIAQGRRRAARKVTQPLDSGKMTYADHIYRMHAIGSTRLLPTSITRDQAPSVRRCIRAWCAKNRPEARYSVKWDSEFHAFRVTRVRPTDKTKTFWELR